MTESNARATIRRATIADIPALSDLLNVLFSQEADFKPNPEKQQRGLRLILENPAIGHIYCADVNGAVAGMVSILFSISTAEGGRAAWMEDLVLHPDHRGKGIGETLLKEATASAKAAGCTRITVLTDATNYLAIRFYKNQGFIRSGMVPFRLYL
jgi:ribosomal protein S18 acetylase RimI-like enzyme